MPGKQRNSEQERRVDSSKRELVERLRAEETLNQPCEHLIPIFDAIDEKIYVADPITHDILYANPAMKKLFGEGVVGKKCHKIMQDLDEPCDFCTNPMIFGDNLGKPHIGEF